MQRQVRERATSRAAEASNRRRRMNDTWTSLWILSRPITASKSSFGKPSNRSALGRVCIMLGEERGRKTLEKDFAAWRPVRVKSWKSVEILYL